MLTKVTEFAVLLRQQASCQVPLNTDRKERKRETNSLPSMFFIRTLHFVWKNLLDNAQFFL